MPQIRLAELLGSLSKALDLTEGQPRGHCVRCCWTGTHIGIEYGLKDQDLSDLYYTLLMKDLGCSSNAARICSLYLTDDLNFKKDFKYIDGSLPHALRFILNHTGLKSGLAERFGALINVLSNGGSISKDLIETRCHQGAEIARKLRFSENVALGIKNLDEHWDGTGLPDKILGMEIPVNSQIALMSQVIDVFQFEGDREGAIQEIINRTGTWFNPAIVEAFVEVADNDDFWKALPSENLHEQVFSMTAAMQDMLVDDDYLDDISIAFAQVIDAKSPFTHGHSERVTLYTDLIAEQLGLEDEHRRWLKRGALLHDIGKLGVSNAILDKNGKPTDEEWEAIKKHPVYSYEILSGISVFENILPVVRGHHERLDGKGYPDGLAGDEISRETRIVTVADIFDALTADRPYRKAMPVERALTIMREEFSAAIDKECFEALEQSLEKIGKLAA